MLTNELRRLRRSILMANTVTPSPGNAVSVTAHREADRMMSSRCADPHQGSSWITALTKEAEYMAATVFPSPITPALSCFWAGSIYDKGALSFVIPAPRSPFEPEGRIEKN